MFEEKINVTEVIINVIDTSYLVVTICLTSPDYVLGRNASAT
jgi:hypothetical protein